SALPPIRLRLDDDAYGKPRQCAGASVREKYQYAWHHWGDCAIAWFVGYGIRYYLIVFGDYGWRDARPNDVGGWRVTGFDYHCCWYDCGYPSFGCLSLFSAPYYRY